MASPRPAVIVQIDAFPESHASVVICQLTSDLADAPDAALPLRPSLKWIAAQIASDG